MTVNRADTHYGDVLATYRYLRVAMPVLGVALGAGVVRQIFQQEEHCWLGSISAYYYTSARAVFVACLCAIGTALIVYRGNSAREDVALNASGFLAFVVAFVPTPLKELTVPPVVETCGRSNVPTDAQLAGAIGNNLFALMVGGTLAIALAWWFWVRVTSAERVGTLDTKPLAASSVAIVVGWFVWGNLDWARQHAHLYAAITLFGGIVLVILMNAWALFRGDAPRPRARYERLYRIVAAAMIVGAVGLGILAWTEALDHTIFWLESLGIGGFVVFWTIQTAELWDVTARGETVEVIPESNTVAPG